MRAQPICATLSSTDIACAKGQARNATLPGSSINCPCSAACDQHTYKVNNPCQIKKTQAKIKKKSATPTRAPLHKLSI